MIYAEASYDLQPMFGRRNTRPAHFRHIVAWQEFRRANRISREHHALAARSTRRNGDLL